MKQNQVALSMNSVMWKKYTLWVLLLICFSCEKITDIEVPEDDSVDVAISESEIKRYLSLSLNENEYDLIPYVEDNDTLMYICNLKEGGWKLLSGDKRTEVLLSFCEEGTLSKVPDSITLQQKLEHYAQYIRHFRWNKVLTQNKYTELWKSIVNNFDPEDLNNYDKENGKGKWYVFDVAHSVNEECIKSVPHMIPTKWGLASPWNTNYPHYMYKGDNSDDLQEFVVLTGSPATALGQLIYFFHYQFGKPTALYHTVVARKNVIVGTKDIISYQADLVLDSPRWDEMAIDKNNTDYAAISYVGDFLMDIGKRINQTYTHKGANISIPLYEIDDLFKGYDISYAKDSCSFHHIRNNLLKNMPVLVAEKPTKGSLIYLIDGYEQSQTVLTKRLYFAYLDSDSLPFQAVESFSSFDEIEKKYNVKKGTKYIEYEERGPIKEYVYMNWGNDGEDDNSAHLSSMIEWIGYDATIFYDFK